MDDQAGGVDDVMENRQVMFWLLATRQNLRAWEVKVAETVGLAMRREEVAGALVWSTQLAHHMALVAGHNLLLALGNADGRYASMPESMARELKTLRDLHEHWNEQWPVFYDPRNPGPLKRSGKKFAELYPERSPYDWSIWNGNDGPSLGPGLVAADLCDYLDTLQAEVLAVAPQLARFEVPIEPSPWLGPSAGRDRWWPRP
jgi:hypothetical protein